MGANLKRKQAEEAEGRQEVDKHLEDKPAPATGQAALLVAYEYQQDEEALDGIALAQCTRNASAAA